MTRLLASAGVLALLSCATPAAASYGGGLAAPNAVPTGGGAVQAESPRPSGTDPGAGTAPSGAGAAAPFQASPAQSGDSAPVAPDEQAGEPLDESDEPVVGDEDVAIVVPLPPDAEPTEPMPADESGPSLPITGFDALMLALLGASVLTVGYAARIAARRAPARRVATVARPGRRR